MISHVNTKLIDVRDEIIKFLKTQPEMNQKLIGIISQNSDEKFWFEPEIAFALEFGVQPLFVFATKSPSSEFIKEVFQQNKIIQGTKSSLDLVNLEFYVIKTSLLMTCDEQSYRNKVNLNNGNISITIADQVKHKEEVDNMIESFSNETKLNLTGSHEDLFSRGTLYIGQVANTVAGCVFLSHPQAHICRITYVYTKPSFRGLGLAKLMVSHALEHAFNKLSAKCILYVNKANTIARTLYESIGFKIIDEYKTISIMNNNK